MSDINQTRILQLEMQKKKTSHIFHFLMCIPTLGLWLFIWAIVGLSNQLENWGTDRKIERLYKSVEGKEDVKRNISENSSSPWGRD